MDPRPWGGAELAGARPAAAPVDGNSSRGCWEVAGVAENLIGFEVWRRGDRVGWATRPNCGSGRSSSAQGLERGGKEMRWGMATVEYGEVRGPFYRVGGWEGRQCGEWNGRRRSAPLMAFKALVLGGERRGRRLARKGKRRMSSGTRFCAEEVTGGHGGTPAFGREVAAS
jgi:hypothetical protein